MKAELIKDNLPNFTGHAALYRLTPPLVADGESHEYVVVSTTNAMYTGPETYIFPSNQFGFVTSFGELVGSYRGGLDHSEALERAGYTL